MSGQHVIPPVPHEERLMMEVQVLRRELLLAGAALKASQDVIRRVEAERDRLRARIDRVLEALDPAVDLEPAPSSADAPPGGPL